MSFRAPHPSLHHPALATTFIGLDHPLSTWDCPIVQFRGIKYASVPARFRQSALFASYPPTTDASRFGPICPQPKYQSVEEEMFALSPHNLPTQAFKQNEFDCLNLNITCPAGLSSESRVPVMVWIHGGGDRGSGSNWVYDGGALVRKSLLMDKPIIMVTLNFRIGLFGFVASASIRDDNKLAGDEGVGNYGLRDQARALEWIHHFIGHFGGDPSNVTLFGQSTGATDIVYHLLSAANESRPLFHRAIVQSPIVDYNLPDVYTAGWHLSRIMSVLRVKTLEQLRVIDASKLMGLGENLRATDDGFFFRKGWKESILPEDHHHHHHPHHYHMDVRNNPHVKSPPAIRQTRAAPSLSLPANLQPLIIGDCAYDSLLWSLPISFWTSTGVVRRLKAVCQSLAKATTLLHAYDIDAHTPAEELVERVLELVNDARVAWPVECVAQGVRRERGGGGGGGGGCGGGRGVWRYTFDQEGPVRGVPHHAADLIYLFDNMPLPASLRFPMHDGEGGADMFFDGPFDVSDDESSDEEEVGAGVGMREGKCVSSLSSLSSSSSSALHGEEEVDEWGAVVAHVDGWSYARVRDVMQERWISFAQGEVPWSEDKVYVFGPEGEVGERSAYIFAGRRRMATWSQVLEPLGMQLVQKIGVELSRGPPI